jgi:two-component system chemotaxis response regulator CheB
MVWQMAEISADELARLPLPGSGSTRMQRDLAVIGASAGGVQALRELVAGLPSELPAAVLVTLHVLPTGTSVLPQILGRAGPLPAVRARHGEPLERGRIYVAPPNYHLLVWDGQIQLSGGPRENGHRPGIDPMFRSAARNYGRRVIGVVLSGTLDDGSAGLGVIKRCRGTTIAQDPADSLYAGMPQSAIDHGVVDHVLAAGEMADCICGLVDEPLPAEPHTGGEAALPRDWVAPEVVIDLAGDRDDGDVQATGLTCPECGGALWAHEEGYLLRFRCREGHAYSTQSMQIEQGRVLESALWRALRGLEEQVDLFERLARRSSASSTAIRFQKRADDASHHANAIRNTILDLGRSAVEGGSEVPVA